MNNAQDRIQWAPVSLYYVPCQDQIQTRHPSTWEVSGANLEAVSSSPHRTFFCIRLRRLSPATASVFDSSRIVS